MALPNYPSIQIVQLTHLFSAFFSGVVGSGLCILSKYPIKMTLFHSWSVNGYVHRVQHGDWFGGKGVGLCQIVVQNQPVNIYIAHVRRCILFSVLLVCKMK